MGKPKDWTGSIFGCWRVIKKLDSRIENCGTSRRYWLLRCECGHEFEKSPRAFRRLNYPVDCEKCLNNPTRDYSKKVHYSSLPCKPQTFYNLCEITHSKEDVTCKNCLSAMGAS